MQVQSFSQTMPTNDAQKTSRLNAPGFDDMVVVRKAWKEENNRSKVIGVDRSKTLWCLS